MFQRQSKKKKHCCQDHVLPICTICNPPKKDEALKIRYRKPQTTCLAFLTWFILTCFAFYVDPIIALGPTTFCAIVWMVSCRDYGLRPPYFAE